MQPDSGRGLRDHPFVVVASLVASLVTVLIFATGLENLPQLIHKWQQLFDSQPASNTQVTQPTATARPLVPDYQTLSLQPWSEFASPETNLGLAPGRNYLSDIPFDTGWTASTQCAHPPNQLESFQLDTNISNPVSVYLLLQAGWGLTEYDGKQIGNVRLGFDDGSRLDIPLTLGFNIRDWAWESPVAVNKASSPTLQPAWSGTAPDGTPGGMDILTVEIPSPQSRLTLTSIQVSDVSQSTIGEANPCIHLIALTVKYLR